MLYLNLEKIKSFSRIINKIINKLLCKMEIFKLVLLN